MKRPSRFLLVLVLLVVGCSVLPGKPTPTPAPTPTPVFFAVDTARDFLKAWNSTDYAAMYNLLAPDSKLILSLDAFIGKYKAVFDEATIRSVKTTLGASQEDGDSAVVAFNAVFETNVVGTLQQDNRLTLRRENNRWGVVWSPSLILAQIPNSGSVKLVTSASARGDILDRKGRPFTQPLQLVIVEVVPSEMKNETDVLNALGKVFSMTPAAVKALYSKYSRDWRTAIGTLTPDQAKANLKDLNLPGIHTDSTKTIRSYPHNNGAAHAIGYIGQVSSDDLVQYAAQGYRDGDMIGKSGLELWGESYLSGQRGGRLVALTSSGAITATLANVPAKQSQNIVTTMDADLVDIMEKALGDKNGAAVALDINNGNVLGMVSHPSYDPNKFIQRMTSSEVRALLNDANAPMLNRVTQSAFPPGSVFKIVSYAAAVEKGVFAPTSLFDDPGYWEGLGKAARKYCWTWPTTGKGHGTINLSAALTASCDVTFYQVGMKLDQYDRALMTSFARAFGLGAATGIELGEVQGNLPDPKTAATWGTGDAINMVIGQGTMLTSPLQIADMLAAVANGGTLYKPHLVARISSVVDGSEKVTQPEIRGKLPISDKTLASIRAALKGVTTDKDGTAAFVFKGDKIISAGKTGTAEVIKGGEPHAWFAGYSPADNPKIALVVIVEHGGEGSKAAAPVFRQIVDKYFALPGNK